MGLDMYLEGRRYLPTDWRNPGSNQMREGFRLKEETIELGQWRKHPDLHGYIVQEFAGGEDNCQDIDLSLEDLEKIFAAVVADQLPHTEGFFFGASLSEDKEPSLKQLAGAIEWLKTEVHGVWKSVVYRASW